MRKTLGITLMAYLAAAGKPGKGSSRKQAKAAAGNRQRQQPETGKGGSRKTGHYELKINGG